VQEKGVSRDGKRRGRKAKDALEILRHRLRKEERFHEKPGITDGGKAQTQNEEKGK